MHLILMTRGISQQRDMWVQFMNSQMFWFKQEPLLKDDKGNFIKNPDGTYQRGPAQWSKTQGALRPYEFFEYVFPSESLPYNPALPVEVRTQTLPQVLAMLQNHKNEKIRKEVAVPAWFMRKMLNLKPVPEMHPEVANKDFTQITDHFIPMEAMAVYPIGIKEDPIKEHIFGNVGFYQEGL